jgi:hypothetical protein
MNRGTAADTGFTMQLTIIINAVLGAGAFVLVVGPLMWAIRTSSPRKELSPTVTDHSVPAPNLRPALVGTGG